MLQRASKRLDANDTLQTTTLGESELSRHGISLAPCEDGTLPHVLTMKNLRACCKIAEGIVASCARIGVSIWKKLPTVKRLKSTGVVRTLQNP